MLLFYLKFQNRLHPPQAQACGFFLCFEIDLLKSTKLEFVFLFFKNTHFERLETEITILLFKKAFS